MINVEPSFVLYALLLDPGCCLRAHIIPIGIVEPEEKEKEREREREREFMLLDDTLVMSAIGAPYTFTAIESLLGLVLCFMCSAPIFPVLWQHTRVPMGVAVPAAS